MLALGTGPAALPVIARAVPSLPVLQPLGLSGAAAREGMAPGDAIGTVTGRTPGSTLVLADGAGARFALQGTTLVCGSTPLDFETARSHQIILRETHPASSGSPRDSVLTIAVSNVFERPDLAALTLSPSTLTAGQSATLSIIGATAGSVLTGTVPPGMVLDSAARTITGTPSAANPAFAWRIEEALADSANSPRASSGTLAIQPAATTAVSAIAADGWQAAMTAPADLAMEAVTLSRAGFDAAGAAVTVTQTLLTTKRVRQPWPDHAQLTANSVALSDYVYATDSIPGCANHSAETSPKPIAAWIMPHRLVVASVLEAEVAAFHRNAGGGRQVACVVFTASDGVNTATATVSSPAVSGRAGDRNAVISYRANIDVTGLAAGLITLNARVYPRIGGAASVADSAADGNAARGFNPRYFLKNTGTRTLAYVKTAANGGNDAAGAVSTSAVAASAAPFATVLAAINALHAALAATSGIDMGEIRIGDDGGTPFVLASTAATRTQKIAALTITRDPAVAKGNARVSFGAAAFRPRLGGSLAAPLMTGALLFRDIAIQRTGTAAFTGEAAANLELIFDGCSFDNGGHAASWLSGAHDYHLGTGFSNLTGGSPLGAGTGEHRLLRGIDLQPPFAAGAGAAVEGWCVLGSAINCPFFGRGARSFSGGIIAFNRLTQPPSATMMIDIAGDQDVAGFAIVQNLVEYTSAATNAVFRVSGDGASGQTSHVVIHANSCAGAFQAGRWNLFYDDGATRRINRLMSVAGNIAVAVYTKSDQFRGAVQAGSDASAATGNWAFGHGVGCRGNFTQFQSNTPVGGNEAQDYPGIGANYGASQTVRNEAHFAGYAGTTVAAGPSYAPGTGGGNYALTGASPARGLLADPVLAFGLTGAPRASAGDAAGAYSG